MAKDWVSKGYSKLRLVEGQKLNGLNLVLDHGFLLKGQVLAKASDRPAPNAAVRLNGPGESNLATTTTDAAGRFFARVSPGEWYVAVDRVGSRETSNQAYLWTTLDAAHNPPVELRVPDALLYPPIPHLAGTVTDAKGAPVPGTSVRVLQGGEATTDGTGRFHFETPVAAGSLLVATKGDAMSAKATQVVDQPSLALRLDGRATSLQGSLTDDSGKPLPGVALTLGAKVDDGYLHYPSATSDANGAFRFDGLYGGVENFFVWAKKTGYGTTTIQPIKTVPGEQKALGTTVMGVADGTIDGTVLGPDGKPAAGASVRSQVQDVPDVETDAQGRFHLAGVPRGKHYLVAILGASQAVADGATGQKDVVIKLTPPPKAIPGLVAGDRTGHAAPALRVAAWTNGTPVDLKALKGLIVVVDLWAVWCHPCVEALSGLQALRTKYAKAGVVVLGIHAPGTPKAKVAAFVKEKGLTYPNAVDVPDPSGMGVTALAFDASGIPHLLVIDANGKIVADTHEVEDVEKAVKGLLGDKAP